MRQVETQYRTSQKKIDYLRGKKPVGLEFRVITMNCSKKSKNFASDLMLSTEFSQG